MTLDDVMQAVEQFRYGQLTSDEVREVIEDYARDRYEDGLGDAFAWNA